MKKPFRDAIQIRENVWYVKQYDGRTVRLTVVPVKTLMMLNKIQGVR